MSAKSEPPASPRRRAERPGPGASAPAGQDARRRVEGRLAELGELVRRLAASARNPELVDYLDRIERSRRALERMFGSHPLGNSEDPQNRETGTGAPERREGEPDAAEAPDRSPPGPTDES